MPESRTDEHVARQSLDELAALFLTPGESGPAEPEAGGPVAEEAAADAERGDPATGRQGNGDDTGGNGGGSRGVTAEALLLGHLPGFASPWITQYAHALAQQEQADVAILDIDAAGGGVAIDLVRSGDPLQQAPPDRLSARTLEQAVAELGQGVSAYLVLVDDASGDGSRRRLERLSRWTLLGAADEASVVGGYRLLKSAPKTAAGEERVVQMAFAGCDEAEAEAAMERLSRAAAAHLGLTLELGLVRQRIEPARRHSVGWCETGDDAVAELVDALARTCGPQRSRGQAADAEEVTRGNGPHGVPVDRQEAGDARATAEREPASTATRAGESEAMAAWVGGAGLAARCPRCPAVELAVDDEGQLHLLRWAAGGADCDRAMRELIEARSWAAEHGSLLALTCPAQPLRTDAEARMHLFTAEPGELLGRLAHVALGSGRLLTLHLLHGGVHAVLGPGDF